MRIASVERALTSRPPEAMRIPWAARILATPVLPDARTTALNQYRGYDRHQHSGNNPNNRCGFHNFPPFLQDVHSLLGMAGMRATPYAKAKGPPVHNASEPVGGVRPIQRPRPKEFAALNLLGAGTAALNDDAEHDGAEHSSGDTNDGHGIHGGSPFSQRCMVQCCRFETSNPVCGAHALRRRLKVRAGQLTGRWCGGAE